MIKFFFFAFIVFSEAVAEKSVPMTYRTWIGRPDGRRCGFSFSFFSNAVSFCLEICFFFPLLKPFSLANSKFVLLSFFTIKLFGRASVAFRGQRAEEKSFLDDVYSDVRCIDRSRVVESLACLLGINKLSCLSPSLFIFQRLRPCLVLIWTNSKTSFSPSHPSLLWPPYAPAFSTNSPPLDPFICAASFHQHPN